MKITNLTKGNLDFVTGVKNGEPVTESLAPGETRDIAARQDETFKARLHTGIIRVEGAKASQTKSAPADKPAA